MALPIKPVSFRWDPEFVAQVDRARGDVPRTVWVRRVIERELEASSPAAAEQVVRAVERVLGSEPPEPPRVRSSTQARRDVKPFPKEHHGS